MVSRFKVRHIFPHPLHRCLGIGNALAEILHGGQGGDHERAELEHRRDAPARVVNRADQQADERAEHDAFHRVVAVIRNQHSHREGDEDDDTAYRSLAKAGTSNTPSPELFLEAQDTEQNNMHMLGEALGNLDERSKAIVTRRWLNEPKATLHELAGEYGVSAERIRQIESNAFKLIKSSFVA